MCLNVTGVFVGRCNIDNIIDRDQWRDRDQRLQALCRSFLFNWPDEFTSQCEKGLPPWRRTDPSANQIFIFVMLSKPDRKHQYPLPCD